ncbi:MAG: hypothetical protein C4318_05385 [Acidimicrobiia bacterium]
MTSPFGPSAAHLQPVEAFGPRTRIVSLSSGKGGVGKSTLTANLAVALAKLGKDVCVIDADVYGFSIPKILGAREEPSVENDKIRPVQTLGVKVVSMGFFVPEEQAVIWRGPMLHKALQQFVADVAWGEPDYVLVDMPPGTGDVAISMSQFLPWSEVIVATTPQHAAERVAQRMAAMAAKVGLEVIGVIENMSYFVADDGKRYEIFGSGGGEDLAAKLDVPLLGKVPLDPALREGADKGRPVVEFEPDSPGARAITEIAAEIDGMEPVRKQKIIAESEQGSSAGKEAKIDSSGARGTSATKGIPLRVSLTPSRPEGRAGVPRGQGIPGLQITPKKKLD